MHVSESITADKERGKKRERVKVIEEDCGRGGGGVADKTNYKCEFWVLIFRLLLRRKEYNIGL